MSRYTRNPGSRLGKFERQRFGGSGIGDLSDFGSLGFTDDMFGPPELISDAPPPPSAAFLEFDDDGGISSKREAAKGTSAVDVVKGIFDTVLGLAPAIVGYVGAKDRAKELEKARKRREADIARAAANAVLGRGGQSAPASSKTGMYLGIGGVALALVAILIVVLLKNKKGN